MRHAEEPSLIRMTPRKKIMQPPRNRFMLQDQAAAFVVASYRPTEVNMDKRGKPPKKPRRQLPGQDVTGQQAQGSESGMTKISPVPSRKPGRGALKDR